MPRWAAAGLGGVEGEGQAMPLQDFIAQAIEELATDSEEIVVKQAWTTATTPDRASTHTSTSRTYMAALLHE